METNIVTGDPLPLRAYSYVIAAFVFAIGSYILTPFFAVYVSETLGFGLAFAGVLITTKVVSQRTLAVFGGMLSDRFMTNKVAIFGVLIRSCSYLLLAIEPTKETLLISSVLNGVGSALFQPAVRKLLFTPFQNEEEKLRKAVVLRSISLNIGTAVGPLIGAFLINDHFSMACLVISGLYAAMSLLFISEKKYVNERSTNKAFNFSLLRQSLTKAVIKILIFQFLFIFIYSNFEYMIPVFVNEHFGSETIAAVFILNSAIVILLQNKVSKLTFTPLVYPFLMTLAFSLFAVASMGQVSNEYWFLAALMTGVLMFSLFEIICSFQVDYELTKASPSDYSGTIFGVSNLVTALSFFVGNAFNYWLYASFGFTNYWIFYFVVACFAIVGALIVIKRSSYAWA